MNNILLEVLEELKAETGLESVGISIQPFNIESNFISQAQENTIIKLLLKINIKLDYLERIIIELGQIINREKYKTEINLEHLDKKLINLNRAIEKISILKNKQDIKDILGPKVIIK